MIKSIEVDFERSEVVVSGTGGIKRFGIGTPEAFAAISKAWLRSGWDTKYAYGFSWLGRPIIQLPEDMIRVQEAVYQVNPDVILECGIAHGGGLVFFASLCKAMGKGRVIGVDVEIRPHNRKAIESHELFNYITLIEGSSVDSRTISEVKSLIQPTEKVFVMLDSNHTKQHVLEELEAYSCLVAAGSYMVAADGIMEDLVGAPRSSSDWSWNNPRSAAEEFLKHHPDFVLENPERPFSEGLIMENVTYWPGAWLKRKSI